MESIKSACLTLRPQRLAAGGAGLYFGHRSPPLGREEKGLSHSGSVCWIWAGLGSDAPLLSSSSRTPTLSDSRESSTGYKSSAAYLRALRETSS